MFEDVKLRWLIVAGVLVTFFEILSLSGVGLRPIIAIPLFTIVILVIGYETLYKGFKALLELNFRSINLLMVVAVAGAFYLGEYEEAAVVIVLFSLAEHLEDVGIAQSKSSLEGLVEQMPKVAFLKGEELPVEVTSLKVGQTIIVKPFQMIPVDGTIKKGASFVDEATITGEPIPKEVVKDSSVFAGTMNKQGVLEVEVTKLQQESVFAKIRDLTFNAMENKAETQKFIESFSQYYTPAIMVFALLWMFVPWLVTDKPFSQGFAESLMLLVIACPCALVISTPISIFSAIGTASEAGAVIKGGRYLEALGAVKTIAFDKTRTLTRGEPVVTNVIPIARSSRAEVLKCAAAVELFSEHPLAQSVVKVAKEENISVSEVSKFESVVGKGAKAECHMCDDQEHFIGALQYLEKECTIPQAVIDHVNRLRGEGKTVMVLSTGCQVDGIIAIEDELRKDSPATVQSLDRLGVSCVMLTGDHSQTANAVASKLGITHVESECLPEDKSRIVIELQQTGQKVGMVGDGINDAPALATADVGISMSGLASDTAIETASVVILNDRLPVIPYLVDLGRRTLNIIKANTIFAVIVKVLVIGFAVAGVTNLALAIFADVGVTILVILNSLRLRRVKFATLKNIPYM